MVTDTSSQQWREECLARHICSLPTRNDRRKFLNGYQLRNGKAAADKLADLVGIEWKKRTDKCNP